jgi:hypothetical protein
MKELRERVQRGAALRWSELNKDQAERLERELGVIEQTESAAYFRVASDIVNAIRAGGGLVGPGRGFCGSSAVCYALGVTDVDPLKYGLLFERMLNEGLEHARPVLIDVDAKGEWIAREYLDSHFKWVPEKRTRAVAPQFVELEGVGEFGITRIPEMDLIAATLDWLRMSGQDLPALDQIEVDRNLYGGEPEKIRYQEDLMTLARRAGMTAAESDRFRKALGLRLSEEASRSRNLFADELWDRMRSRARECVMKCHCVCYAKLNLQVAAVKDLRDELCR